MIISAVYENFHNHRGMTLVEIMMAVSVFGIIMIFMTQMTSASSRLTWYNQDQVRMSELAMAEAEKIKAGSACPADLNNTISYPPGAVGGDVQQIYAIKYCPRDANGILKIIIGPVDAGNPSEPLNEENPDNYELVAWLP